MRVSSPSTRSRPATASASVPTAAVGPNLVIRVCTNNSDIPRKDLYKNTLRITSERFKSKQNAIKRWRSREKITLDSKFDSLVISNFLGSLAMIFL